MRQRALYLLKFYVATLFFFVAAKIGFMLYQHGGHDFTFTDMLQVIGHGLSSSPFLFFWWRHPYGYEFPNGVFVSTM